MAKLGHYLIQVKNKTYIVTSLDNSHNRQPPTIPVIVWITSFNTLTPRRKGSAHRLEFKLTITSPEYSDDQFLLDTNTFGIKPQNVKLSERCT